MWNLGSGRTEAAWADLRACLRFARFTAEGPTLVDQLVAMALNGIASSRTVTLLHYGNLDENKARQILHDLTELGPPTDVVRTFDTGERLQFADFVLLLATHQLSFAEMLGAGYSNIDPLSYLNINWNSVLLKGNRRYDRLIQSAKLPTALNEKQPSTSKVLV